MNVQIKALKVFCDVVGYRSFSRAAAENGISQSGASQIVQQLEEMLAVRLIDRSKRPFVLTSEGETYYEGCHQLVQRYASLEEEVRTLHQEVAGRVTVASIYSVGLSYRQELFDRFRERYPKACVQFEYHHPNRVYELVAEDRVNLGLISYGQATRLLELVDWCQEPMVLVCDPDHAFSHRGTVAVEELNAVEMIGFDRDLKIRRQMDRELAARGVEPRVGFAFDNIDTIKQAIVVNQGISFLPEPTVRREIDSGELIAVRVEGLQLTRPLGIIFRRGSELGKTARRFIQFLTQGAGRSVPIPEPAPEVTGSHGAAK